MATNNYIRKRVELLVFLSILLFWPATLWAGIAEIKVATASSMKLVFEEIGKEFHDENPEIIVRLSFGSSGNFFSQIVHGAPYDVFFSSDTNYPKQLAKKGKSLGNTPVALYAIGRIVLWVPDSIELDVKSKKANTLLSSKVKKIALANPKHAPYGRAAIEWMKKSGVYSQVKSRFVLGENISQATQFVHTQAAQAGILALSLVGNSKMKSTGSFWEIPKDQHSPIEQGFLILKDTQNPLAARSFAEFVTGPKGTRILKKYGFDPLPVPRPVEGDCCNLPLQTTFPGRN